VLLADRSMQAGLKWDLFHLRLRVFVPSCSRKEPALLPRKKQHVSACELSLSAAPVSRLTLELTRDRAGGRETTLHLALRRSRV